SDGTNTEIFDEEIVGHQVEAVLLDQCGQLSTVGLGLLRLLVESKRQSTDFVSWQLGRIGAELSRSQRSQVLQTALRHGLDVGGVAHGAVDDDRDPMDPADVFEIVEELEEGLVLGSRPFDDLPSQRFTPLITEQQNADLELSTAFFGLAFACQTGSSSYEEGVGRIDEERRKCPRFLDATSSEPLLELLLDRVELVERAVNARIVESGW